MYDPYAITPQLQQPVQPQQPQVAPGTMPPNMNPQDEAAKRQKMMMMAEMLRAAQPAMGGGGMGGDVVSASGNPLASAMGGAGQVLGMGNNIKGFMK